MNPPSKPSKRSSFFGRQRVEVTSPEWQKGKGEVHSVDRTTVTVRMDDSEKLIAFHPSNLRPA